MHRRRGPILLRAGIVLVWLLIGAAANVGVAWGVAIPFQRHEFGGLMRLSSYFGAQLTETPHARRVDVGWPVHVPPEWPERPEFATSRPEMWGTDVMSFESPAASLILARHGLPFRSMSSWAAWLATPSPEAPPSCWPRFAHGGALSLSWLPWQARGQDSVPVHPLWPGFALNTLFYAALAWGLWQIPLALRRQRRRRAGRCVWCGYDRKGIADDAACPECGVVPRGSVAR